MLIDQKERINALKALAESVNILSDCSDEVATKIRERALDELSLMEADQKVDLERSKELASSD